MTIEIEIYQCLLLWVSGLLTGLLLRREGKTGPMGPMGPMGPPGMMGEPGTDGADGLDCICRMQKAEKWDEERGEL